MNVSLGVILICCGTALLFTNVVPVKVFGVVMCVVGMILVVKRK